VLRFAEGGMPVIEEGGLRIPSLVDTYLFDLDGTLVDSASRIRQSLRATLRDCLGIDPDEDEVARYTGVPLWDIMCAYDEDEAPRLVDYYRRYYAALGPTAPFPGVRDILDYLWEAGCGLAVVTAKGSDSAWDHLEEAELSDYFPVVVTADEVRETKPSREPVMRALARLDRSAARSIMIGDSAADILSGYRAGTYTGWARWGTDRCPDFEGVRPDFTWEEPEGLMTAIRVR